MIISCPAGQVPSQIEDLVRLGFIGLPLCRCEANQVGRSNLFPSVVVRSEIPRSRFRPGPTISQSQ